MSSIDLEMRMLSVGLRWRVKPTFEVGGAVTQVSGKIALCPHIWTTLIYDICPISTNSAKHYLFLL